MFNNYLLVALISETAFWPLFVRLRSLKTLDIFEPSYVITASYFMLFVVQPLLLLQHNHPLTTESAFAKTLFYAWIGLIAFYMGYYARIGKTIGRRLPRFGERWSPKRLYQMVFIFISLSLLSGVFLIFGIGKEGIIWILTHPLEFNYQYLKAGTGYVIQGILLLQKAYFILFAISLAIGNRWAMIISHILGLIVILFYLPMGARWIVVVTILVPILIRHYYQDKRVRLRHVALSVPFLILLLGFMNVYRGTGQFSVSEPMRLFFIGILTGDLLTPFNNFVQLVIALDSGTVEYQYGLYYLYLLIAPIPRALWPDKPVVSVEWAFTEKVMNTNPLHGSTYTLTIPGDLFFNLHVSAILVGMFLWGVFWRAIYAWLLKNRDNVGCILIYAVLLLAGFNLVRTSLQTFIITALVETIPLSLALIYIGRGIWKSKGK